ncbi:hypothetical protein XH87_13100 [Bradyrhizobium sp. CCBAU 53415]|nr:hypothetical protein [Bradyrhizobium sp. CCBAU 53415]
MTEKAYVDTMERSRPPYRELIRFGRKRRQDKKTAKSLSVARFDSLQLLQCHPKIPTKFASNQETWTFGPRWPANCGLLPSPRPHAGMRGKSRFSSHAIGFANLTLMNWSRV